MLLGRQRKAHLQNRTEWPNIRCHSGSGVCGGSAAGCGVKPGCRKEDFSLNFRAKIRAESTQTCTQRRIACSPLNTKAPALWLLPSLMFAVCFEAIRRQDIAASHGMRSAAAPHPSTAQLHWTKALQH